MKYKFLFAAVLALAVSCGPESPKDIPQWGRHETQTDTTGTEPVDTTGQEQPKPERTEIADYTDMVLLYGYGHHRSPVEWGTDYTDYYVKYSDKEGHQHWLFDAFLFLEFMDPATNGGAGVTFITGYSYDNNRIEKSATQKDWDNLAKYYFVRNTAVYAVDQSVEKAKAILGEPPHKRQIVVGIPEPIVHANPYDNSSSTTYWGQVDGRTLDFNLPNDRVAAVKWFIDRVREEFYKCDFKNVELAGFYWVAEKSTHTSTIIADVGTYLKGMNYSFNWIPYFEAEGWKNWQAYGFTYAFMQPNTAWLSDEDYAAKAQNQMMRAIQDVIANDMGLEVEFDANVLINYKNRAYRLRDYMNAFKDYGAWEKSRLVYYQGAWAVRQMARSNQTADVDLYHEFCEWMITRPIRDSR